MTEPTSVNFKTQQEIYDRFTSVSDAELAKLAHGVSESTLNDCSLEQKVIELNKQAMSHLNNEKVHGNYGMIDEN